MEYSDEYFVGPIRRRITDKAPMSLPSGRRRDLSQKSKEGSLKHVITIRAEYIPGLKNETSQWCKYGVYEIFSDQSNLWSLRCPSMLCTSSSPIISCTSLPPELSLSFCTYSPRQLPPDICGELCAQFGGGEEQFV